MRTSENHFKDLIELPHTEVWVPELIADKLARNVYHDFTSNIGVAEALARLSFVAQNNFDPAFLNTYLSVEKDPRDTLRIRHYPVELIPKIVRDEELAKTAMVANMVVPEVEEDDIVGYHLQEPFPANPMLDRMYEREYAWMQVRPSA